LKPVPGSKIVLTGGPCAGKTTMAEMLSRSFPSTVVNVPEAASLLFSGGFPRFSPPESQRATQRAIFQVQRELEATYSARFPDRVLVLDRGTVDGAAYWPEGPEAYFAAFGTSLTEELARYARVIYLESAGEADYALHRQQNPNRSETWAEARRLDERTFQLWSRHPNFLHIKNNRSFSYKVSAVLAAFAGSVPFGGENEPE
jgi:predicted ATPase